MKRWITALLACFTLLTAPTALAAFDDTGVKTRHIVLMEMESGAVLYEKAGRERAFPASTTKIMTCILALELGDLDAKVTVPDVTTRGSTMGIRRGETMSLRSLIYGMMLVSGNDAAEAIAAHIGGSKAEFVQKMNDKAQEIGMMDTHFVEPSGLHKEEHYTTAYDFALLTRYAMQQSEKKNDFRAIVGRKNPYSVKDSSKKAYELETSNKLLYTKTKDGVKLPSFEYRYATGVKTGDTDFAMRCIVASAKKDDIELISVQFYDEAADYRFELAAKLFDWGFDNFATASATTLGLPDTLDVPVRNASFDDAVATGPDGNLLTLRIDTSKLEISADRETIEDIQSNVSAVEVKLVSNEALVAPVEENAPVGKVSYTYKGEVLFTADAYATRSVSAIGRTAEVTPTQIPNILRNGGGGAEGTAGPWLFIILVLVGILFMTGLVLYIRSRNKRYRRRRKRTRIYSGRR